MFWLWLSYVLGSLLLGKEKSFSFLQESLLESLRERENTARYVQGRVGEAFLIRRAIHRAETATTYKELVKAIKGGGGL